MPVISSIMEAPNYYASQPLMTPNQWRFVSDQVMGGVSRGNMKPGFHHDRSCIQLTGQVHTANNGGFIKLAHELTQSEKFAASDAEGIELTVMGNNEAYNVHLNTSDLYLPWQSYRSSFLATPEWKTIQLPFSSFQPYRVEIGFNQKKLSRVSVVAIGRDFEADLYISDAGYY